MRVDVGALETFNRLAHEGAEHAARSLSRLTATAPTVEATSIDFVPRADLTDAFDGGEFVGVEVGFDGGFSGRAILAFERSSAEAMLESLPSPGEGPDAPDQWRDRVAEVGNILIGGFMDGWADHLGAAIDITPPTFVAGSGGDLLPEDAPTWDGGDQLFALTSRLEATDTPLDARIYLFPERDVFVTLESEETAGAPVPLEELATFNRMTARGAENASEDITTMTGIDTEVEVTRLSFVPIASVPDQVANDSYTGTVFELEGLPSGYLAILFDEASVRTLTEAMLPGRGDDEFGSMHRSAIEEIGNVMTSGFIDGWANVLGTSIEHSPPQFVRDLGPAIMDPVAARMGKRQEHGFLIDTTIETADRSISCELYALPDGRELRTALERLADREEVTPEDLEANYDDL